MVSGTIINVAIAEKSCNVQMTRRRGNFGYLYAQMYITKTMTTSARAVNEYSDS